MAEMTAERMAASLDSDVRRGRVRVARARHRLARMLPEDVRGKRILDVGTGPGDMALYLHLIRGARVGAVDEYEGHGEDLNNYERLLERIDRLGVTGMDILKTSALDVQLDAGSYDYVLMSNVLHHMFLRGEASLERVTGFLRTVNGWLKPDGHLIIGDIGTSTLWSWARIPRRYRLAGRTVDFRSKSSDSWWTTAAVRADFRLVRRRLVYERSLPRSLGEVALGCLTPTLLHRLRHSRARSAGAAENLERVLRHPLH